MMIYNVLESIKLFIIRNPWETVFFMGTVFTFFGMYMEDVFKIWNWGPQCSKCKDYTFWSTSISHCDKCYDNTMNGAWEDGYAHGERGIR